MSKGNTFENDLLGLVFNASAIANIADDAGSSPLTNLFVSLHTADPGEAGDQTSNESAYAEYARQAVARTGSGWDVASGVAAPLANIDFPQHNTTTTEQITYFGVGTTSGAGAGTLLYSGAISPVIDVGDGVTPRLTTGSTVTED